jgi:hypothetical protein
MDDVKDAVSLADRVGTLEEQMKYVMTCLNYAREMMTMLTAMSISANATIEEIEEQLDELAGV